MLISGRVTAGRGWTVWMVLTGLTSLLLAGCGEKYSLAPVSGKVTLEGKPVEKAAVTFAPIGGQAAPGPGSSGITDAQGRFTLQTIGDKRQSGAVVGKHRVTVNLADPGLDKLSYEEGMKKLAEHKQLLPLKARDGSLTFEVPRAGTTEANFEFTSGGP